MPAPIEGAEVNDADPPAERWARWWLSGPLAAGISLLCCAQLLTWIPHYLTWPWWADHDVFAVLAQGWDAGLLPYRDLKTNQFPGTIYLFWILGKAAGWGQTWALYAADAAGVVCLGIALLVWSRRRFGHMLPGAAGYLTWLAYSLSLDYTQAAQRDWHGPLCAVLGLLALEIFPGWTILVISSLATAAAGTIRPQTILFVPAAIVAIIETSHGAGFDRSQTGRRLLAWIALTAGFLAIGFAPVIASGLFGDFMRAVRSSALGETYNTVTLGSFAGGMLRQLTLKDLALLVTIPWLVMAIPIEPSTVRTARIWLVALVSVSLYMPLSPYPHTYLGHPLRLVAAINVAILLELILETRATAAVRLCAVILAIGLGASLKPPFSNPTMSRLALPFMLSGQPPEIAPLGYRTNPAVLLAAVYPWRDYAGVLDHLQTHTSPSTRVANALQGVPALAGPAARLPAFPAESTAWLFMVNRDDEAAFADRLAATSDSVVVWAPSEIGDHKRFDKSFALPLIEAVVRRLYQFEARFGTIEVWRRRADSLPGN